MFFYVRTTTYRARTGPVDSRMNYPCAHCSVQSTALVRSEGNGTSVAVYGGGGSPEMARRKAFEAAHKAALDSLKSSACPSCGRLQPFVLAEYGAAERRLAWRRKVGVPIAGGLALLAGLLIAIAGFADIRHSAALLAVALGVTLTVGGLGIGGSLRRWTSPLKSPGNPGGLPQAPKNVWFWWSPSSSYRGSAAAQWCPAPQPVHVPQVAQPPANAFVLGLLTAAFGGALSLVSLVAWGATFESLHVVNTQATPISVLVDGEKVGQVSASGDATSHDVMYETFQVRSGEKHHLEIVDATGKKHAYDLPAAGGSSGWLVAPDSKEAGLCLIAEEVVYGTGEGADPDLLNLKGDLMELHRSYDDMLEASPATMSTNGSSARRWALRGMACDSLENDEPLSFRARAKAPKAKP
jgi:hypothetical protein